MFKKKKPHIFADSRQTKKMAIAEINFNKFWRLLPPSLSLTHTHTNTDSHKYTYKQIRQTHTQTHTQIHTHKHTHTQYPWRVRIPFSRKSQTLSFFLRFFVTSSVVSSVLREFSWVHFHQPIGAKCKCTRGREFVEISFTNKTLPNFTSTHN